MTRTARVRAYAKLNLGLRVLYKREDGFHEIRTVFQSISLSDSLGISWTPARSTRIAIGGTPEIADNLVERAARRVLEALKMHGDVRFELKKNIPAGAGLGGGSSDAAAVLLALPVLAGKRMGEEKLFETAAALGSDVPFFLQGGTALGLGRGEELYPLADAPARRGLIVAPAVHSATAEAYRLLSPTLSDSALNGLLTTNPLQNKLFSFQREVWQRGGVWGENDFESVVFAQHPELERIRNRLRRLGASPARMTGSGSAVFGLFEDGTAREKARKAFSNERVLPISFLSRAAYRSRWIRDLRPHTKENQWPPLSLYAR